MEKSKKQMQTMLQEHTKEITRQSGETTKLMTTQNSTLSKQMSQMKLIQGTSLKESIKTAQRASSSALTTMAHPWMKT
jgi:hypothetical protein